MSLSVYPPVPPHELVQKAQESLDRELDFIVQETHQKCNDLKHGLEDCYALLAPIDPGSTLVMSTSRSERVKGTITRVGTRIVKGSLNLQLRTVPIQTISLSPTSDIHIPPLELLHTNLTQAIDLLGLTLSSANKSSATTETAASLSSTLSLLADSLTDSISLLKNQPPLLEAWQTASTPPQHFNPPLPPNLSFHLSIEDCALVLYLRSLEPVDQPLHLGMKLGLALGTFRRLEHDEMDMVFKYDPTGNGGLDTKRHGHKHSSGEGKGKEMEEVYVREKIRIETGDPNLISLHSKLGFLSHMLGEARNNLSAVMGTDDIE